MTTQDPDIEPDEQPDAPRAATVIARGASWNVLGQVATMAITIFLTPYILHGLGITRYGLFLLMSSLISLLSTLDGGITSAAQREFAIFAGSNNDQAATRLLVTLLLIVGVVGTCLSIAGWFIAAPIVDLLSISHLLRAQSVFLFRTLGILISFSLFHALFAGILQAHNRFSYVTKAGLACYGVWALGLIATVQFNLGLRGIAGVFVVQQFMLAVVIVPASLSYVHRRHLALLPWSELRVFLSFALKIQLTGVSAVVNQEFDTVVVGGAFSVRDVSFYNTGANFANNVASLVSVAIWPAQTVLANTHGRTEGRDTFRQFARLQELWVTTLTGWFAVAGGAAWFAVVAWLGRDFRLSGTIAIIAVVSQLFNLSGSVLATYCIVIGEPGVVGRWGIVSMVTNVVLTVPAIFTGSIIWVVVATCVGQVLGSAYLLRYARVKVDPDIPNMFRHIPLVSPLVGAAVVVALELLIRPVVPGGGAGLIVCAFPAAVGLSVFALLQVGPRRCLGLLRTSLDVGKRDGLKAAMTEILAAAAGD